MEKQIKNSQKPNLVLGKVSDRAGRPLPNFTVQVYDKDLRSEELLAETITNKEGNYQVSWLHSQLSGRGKKEADILIKVYGNAKKDLLFVTDMDFIRFNASPREVINITLTSEIRTAIVEYDYLKKEVGFLANKIAIKDLQENKENRDVSFLSKELEIGADKIEHLIVAHKLEAEAKIDAAFFYAMIRQNTLLKHEFSKPLQSRISVGLKDDPQILLYDAALLDPKTIQKDVAAAAKELVVQTKVAKEAKNHIESLQRYRKQAEAYYKEQQPKKIVEIISQFVLQGKIEEVGKLFKGNLNDMNVFFNKITDPGFFANDKEASDAKINMMLGKIFGFDKELITQIAKSKKIKNSNDIKQLAKLNKKDWVSVFSDIKMKERYDKNTISLLASNTVRKMEKEYPTMAFAAQLERETKSIYTNKDKISRFLNQHEDFDLVKHNIDLFIKDKKIRTTETSEIKEELKSIQRVFKLVPHYSKTNALRKVKINSAQDIAAIGQTRFVKEIAPKAGLNNKEAKEIFSKAVHVHTAAMLIAGELQDTMRAMDIAAMETSTLAGKLEAVSKDFPNLKSLFKLTDTCTCEHCRSVYSPAAYMVELLQFLDKRTVTDLTVIPNVTATIAKDVLFERRPDLGDIDLGCENANTPVKYIDLVCELLEEIVAPDTGISYTGDLSDGTDKFQGKISAALLGSLQTAGLQVTDKALIFETEITTGSPNALPHYLRDKKVVCKIIHIGGNNFKVFQLRQTLSAADELAAAPEYVNANAYAKLATSAFAFKLPFDLNHHEATSYFNRFDISRAELMLNFQVAGTPSNAAIASEKTGLTHAESLLIVTPAATLAAQQLIWNAPPQWDTPPIAGNVLDYMKRVDHFLDKTGLTYKELDLLLALKFIGTNNNLFIKNLDLSCDTEKKEIANFNLAALDRIHRFLRLQKKTGWPMEVLDELIMQPKLGNGVLDNSCIEKAALLVYIKETTGIKISDLVGFYGTIPHEIINDEAPLPLYHQVFLNKAKNGEVDNGLQPERINNTQFLSDFIDSLSVCLQMKQQDLEKILGLLPNDNLNYANLSYLFAAARLMKKLRLKADDFVLQVELTNINFSNTPKETTDFIKAINDFKKCPIKAADVKYMLAHEATTLPDLTEKAIQILEALQKNFQTNFSLNQSRFDENLTATEQQETLQNSLAGLSGITEDDVKTFITYIDKGWTNVVTAKTFIDDKLSMLFDATSIKNNIDSLEAVLTKDQDIADHEAALQALADANELLRVALTPAEIATASAAITAADAQLLITLPKYNIASGKNLLAAFLDSIALYQLALGKQLILEQQIATSFKYDLELVKIVLKYAQLKQPLPGTGFLTAILQSDILIDTDPAHVVPVWLAITDVNFPDQFAAIKLLHKMLPLINAFNISNDQIQWHFINNTTINWFAWDSIPYVPGQVAVGYDTFMAFVLMLDFSNQFKPVVNPADAENPISFITVADMVLPASTTSRETFIESFSLLTGYELTDIDEIDSHLFPVFSLNNYQIAKNWELIIDCADQKRILGASIVQLKEYMKPVLLPNDVHIVRAALKSRYDEDTWLSTLKEIMDAIRPLKRNALVAYILATNPEMKDENYLFDYFLVDVEMESCMPSSRIVQAHGSIQLFVQRCLMGLEPKAAANVDNDASWTQWKWMKNYRVWEANRKVFLYPENWIEPDLRDDKSFLFTEFENELQQNELTDLTAETSLIRYLEKLDNIAFLEVMATWYQVDIKTMHVFARTKGGDPAMYYYRRFEEERYWTPWEKVDLDITGNQLLAFVRNNRLCLAWPVYSELQDPDQGATLPDQSDTSEQPVDKPRRKLKIQLAVSEFANKIWQPKKVSQEGITTPTTYTTSELPRDIYNMLYFEIGQQVWIFNSYLKETNEGHEKNGIFNLTGCKGYPELVNNINTYFPDFYPDFKDALLKSQRYYEWNSISGDDFSVRNGISLFWFYEILKTTPGNFRITYPHQITKIDLVVMIYEYFIFLLLRGKLNDRMQLKVPLGTLLPYFKENSEHAYVIVPGFYGIEKDTQNGNPVAVKRTASNALQLIEDIQALISKYIALYLADPAHDIAALLQKLLADNDFQEIVAEIKVYGSLQYGEQFKNMYHPLVCSLRKTLYKDGIPELMKRETQLQKTSFDFKTYFTPNELVVPKLVIANPDGTKTTTFPIEDLDFTSDGSYSAYNWELFFHVPLLLATRLTRNQRFEEALTWFHYMFNPTGALSGNTPQKYWVTKPFYLNQEVDYINQRIDTLLYKIADPTTPERIELEFAISEWRENPFMPDVVARFRPVAYQKALLMKYIDNLTEWGDYLFRQDTMESIAQATQMYILADKILGPKPRIISPAVKPPYETYNQIENKLDAFGNALIELENILPDLTVLPEGGNELPTPPFTLSMMYFCIPQNDKMLAYWDKIADRLFKIRHCQNIDGIERSLALFAPPIDPAMLVRAAASGLDLSAVIAGLNAPTPYYRFNVLSQKAIELAQEVRGLGNSLLQALEKKDTEGLTLLRSALELKVLNAVKDIKKLQIKESKEQIEVLKRTKKVTEERHKYYAAIEKISSKEQLNMDKLDQALGWQTAANIVYTLGAGLALVPDFALGVSGFGGSPHGAAKFGGSFLAHSTDAIGKGLGIFSTIASFEANRAATMGGYDRRFDDWKLQERLAKKELETIDKQIATADIRKEIAETDLKNHELQIDNARKTDEFMHTKFTNKDLYDWMIGQISSVYFSAYKLAHDVAKKAERSYKFELGNDDSFIAYGYWDSMKKGLQTADRLVYDIKRMETSYLDKNKREYEITKHVSLALLDPLALTRLRATGICDFEIPEALFDMDHAGQYFRRLKSVSISLPCIAGPYTSVSGKLSLVNNRYRNNPNPDNLAATGYIEDPGNDERFVYNVGAIQSIATSNAQNDSGVFELNFRDERYLPFEGTGAISGWRFELPALVRQFNYETIADVVVHIKYTAREGGSGLKNISNTALLEQLGNIKQELSQNGLHVALNMKHDLPNEWYLFKQNGTISLTLDKTRLPYMAQALETEIIDVMFIAKATGNPVNFAITIDGGLLNLAKINDDWQLCKGVNSDVELDTPFTLAVTAADLPDLEELMLVVKYGF
jgi:hypothetical protein